MRQKGRMMFILIFVVLAGCTQKENPVGYNPVNEPRYLELKDNVIGNCYSYEDSISNYMNSSTLTIGNYNKYKMMSLFRFYNLPDSVAVFESETISLKLVVKNQAGEQSSTYKFGRISEYWEQNYVTYQAATDTTDWDNAFEEAFWESSVVGEYVSGDTLEFAIPREYFYQETSRDFFAVDSLIAQFGFYIERSELDIGSSSFMEYNSSESDISLKPRLRFSYKADITEEEFSEWESGVVYDASIYNSAENDLEEFEIFVDELKLQNISPMKMFLELDLDHNDFISENIDTGIDEAADFEKMTINKAMLVLCVKDRYGSNEFIYTQPALLTDPYFTETPETGEIPVYNEHYELVNGVSTTNDSINTIAGIKYYKIDITSEIQAISSSSDDFEGYGLIIRSLRENRDFSFTEFYNSTEEPELMPYLEVYYTPPLEP